MRARGRYPVLIAVAAMLPLWPPVAAQAHDGVRPTLHHDGVGSVWATAVWQDGHAVTEPMLATLSGYSDSGEVISPAALQPLAHQQGTMIRPGLLPAGDWTLTLDIAAPGLGYCQARITIGPGALPGKVLCDPDPAPAPTAAAESTTAWWALIAAAATALLLGALTLRRLRPRNARRATGGKKR